MGEKPDRIEPNVAIITNDGSQNLESDSTRPRANRKVGESKRAFFSWFDPNDSPAERWLVLKLDFFIMTFAFIGFWVLYIDRGILANAYVSGMKEDLHFTGNELVQLTSLFNAGYCISMIPATLLVTRFPAHKVVPSFMFVWGIFTLLLYRTPNFSYLAGFRFLIGILEGPYFCSVHFVLGSWYRGDELVRRAGIFYVSSGVGTMSTGFLAAAIYKHLDGVNGLEGWRWMYIIPAIVTFPVAIWGFFSFPGNPRDGKRWFLTEDEMALAKERMELQGRSSSKGLTLKWETARRFFGRWHFWILVPWNVSWLLGYQSMGQGAYTLWLKAQKQYSVVDVNNYTAVAPGLGIGFILLFSWISDKGGRRSIVPMIGIVSAINITARFAFVLYDKTSFSYKWFAVALSYLEVSLSPVNYSIANLACAGDAEERAFIISSMLAIGQAFNCWVPLLDFPTVKAPRYFSGYVTEVVLQFVYFGWTVVVVWFLKREKRGKLGAQERESDTQSDQS